MAKHAKLSASASDRWMTCSASVKAINNAGRESQTSSFALHGTAAHELAEVVLTSGLDVDSFINQEFSGVVLDQEFAECVKTYTDYVKAINGIRYIEVRVDYSQWVKDGFGTADAIIYDKADKRLHVVDLKTGKGIPVYAENNSQLQLYALGAYSKFSHLYNIENITLHIHQPRIYNDTTWDLTKEQLLAFGEYARERAELTFAENPVFVPSEKACRWCPIKGTCEALAKVTFETVSADFENLAVLEATDVKLLTEQQIADIMTNIPLLELWIKAVKEEALSLANKGNLKGYKLVSGRNSRKWDLPEKELVKKLKQLGLEEEQIYETEVISVAKAEKLVGKERKGGLSSLYKTVVGNPTIALESDKREAISVDLSQFEVV